MQLIERRAPISPETLDREARTVEAVFSTGAPVQRAGYVEVLDLQGADLSALIGGPVLDSHRKSGLADVLGVVDDARIENGRGIAKLRFSERADAVLRDIEQGILRGISIGYSVEAWRDDRGGPSGLTRTAVRWTPREISLVPMPADAGATIRSMKGNAMQDDTVAPALDRGEVNKEIRRIARLAGLDHAWSDAAIDRGLTVEAARSEAFDALASRPQVSTIRQGVSYDDPAVRATWLGEALHHRANPGHDLSEPARQYVGYRTADVAREILRLHGVSTIGLAPATLHERALSTSDYPLALGEAVRLSVMAGYSRAPEALLSLAESKSVPDFNQHSLVAGGDTGLLQVKREGAEIRYLTVSEREEKLQVQTFAGGLVYTREAIINDHLGLISDAATKLGTASKETENAEAVRVLTLSSGVGPVLGDGVALFHTSSHGNLASSGAAPSEQTLSAARLAMRTQTNAAGYRIGISPHTVIVPAALETSTEKLLATIQAATTATVNPFSSLRLMVESRLTDTAAWYVIGSGAPGMVVVRLEGRSGPQVDSTVDFETKSVKFSIINDFAVDFLDHRAWYRNPGQ